MEIPSIGKVTKDEELDWYYSEPIRVPVLGDQMCQIIVEGYDEDSSKDDFHAAIRNFLSLDQSVLKQAEADVFQYYKTVTQTGMKVMNDSSPSNQPVTSSLALSHL